MFRKGFFRLLAFVLLVGSTLAGTPALAITIDPGLDYFATPAGSSSADLGPLGIVNLKGKAFGPGDTDTIVQRSGPSLNLVNPGDTGTMPIELVALSLMSTAPVDLGGGSFGDVYVTINHTLPPIAGLPQPDPLPPSLGEITITYNGSTGGTFSSFFDVFVDVIVTTVGGDPSNPGDVLTSFPQFADRLTASGPWSATPRFDSVDPRAGFFPGVDPETGGKVLTPEESALARHGVLPGQVPEIDAAAGTGALSLLAGALALAGERRRRKAA